MTLGNAHRAPRRGDHTARSGGDVTETRYLVRLDLEAVRRCLSREDRTTYSLDRVRQWLRDAGFRPMENGWLVRAADLGQVQPSEVLHIEPWLGPLPS
jgi:hypothetical protein